MAVRLVGYMPKCAVTPGRGFDLAGLVGRHGGIADGQILADHVRLCQVVQETTDAATDRRPGTAPGCKYGRNYIVRGET